MVVTLEPQLGISDYGAWEDVRGRVYSFTGAPARDVKRMDIGGALLRGSICDTAYDDPTPAPTQQVFEGTHYGYSPWTNWERGFNHCWKQTGHNYFRIRVSKGEIWVSQVYGDTVRDM